MNITLIKLSLILIQSKMLIVGEHGKIKADDSVSFLTLDVYLACFMKEETHLEIVFENGRQEEKDIIIALLTNMGFDGFDESDDSLKAYINKSSFYESDLYNMAELYSLSYIVKEIEAQNWNAVWESNFEPVVIDNFVAVRADFHQPLQNIRHEIIITPKMSFGTGHHATTTMMMQQMRDLDFLGKTVFDFGAGTGILSILAERLGAEEVLAVDNDKWSINNSKENIERNDCRKIKIEFAGSAAVNNRFDIILANINRHIILENFAAFNERLYERSHLLLSGLLVEDEVIILKEAEKYPLLHHNTRQLGQWISLLFGR